MKKILQITCMAVVFLACLLLEQKFFCFGVIAGFIILLSPSFLPEKIIDKDKWMAGWYLLVVLILPSTWLHKAIGLRPVKHDNGTVSVVTSFYPLGYTLGTGIEIDTIYKMRRGYESGHTLLREDMYVLIPESGRDVKLFSSDKLILEGHDLTFGLMKIGDDSIQVARFTDLDGIPRVFDLYGRDTTDPHYQPHVEFDFTTFDSPL